MREKNQVQTSLKRNESSPCHHDSGAVDAVSCGGRQQHRGGVASHRCLPQRDW